MRKIVFDTHPSRALWMSVTVQAVVSESTLYSSIILVGKEIFYALTCYEKD